MATISSSILCSAMVWLQSPLVLKKITLATPTGGVIRYFIEIIDIVIALKGRF